MHVSRNTWLIALALAGTACASRGPALENMEADALFEYGMAQLEERDWSDAEAAFQRLVFQFPNHPRVPEARYRIAETFVGRKEHVTAAIEFNRLATDFPAGPWADDARFRVCESYYRLSPRPPLHQEYTQSAIDHCNAVIAYFPDSDFVPRAREIIREMTDRLAEKEYSTGLYYFRRGAYHSGNSSFDRVVENFPGSVWAPRALLRLYESYQKLKYDQEAQATRERLLRDYPDSPEARQLSGSAHP